ncbi:unnamed protein product (macronuclear) [Paramecium tetraurelia]|uniref:AAA+ ATPase domain-containing protein n=1 Tax=Paramecium tetraurelia TaxID=5888 RepID=A0EG83_PARTE|nr:uncharacterized protein GSPATT00026648001 [Paramecium tetraurelia]CAK94324.1 unnamed protein product [Paramecium tetraurelia]|eukprot:XP_001461697.1 hypothetical protein (macronuclear) [Paramecium tetraurelia strain d4-2]
MENNLIWLEKYRPKTLDEVHGNSDIVDKLRAIAKMGNLPNIILVGPPGIGKTSSVLCLARQILGDSIKESVLELNASDDRGIETVREQIKGFAQKKVNLQEGQHKIVILDEADSLTEGAQQALRMIISDYSTSTRFVLSCNDSTKLIDAIQSRCCILRFNRLGEKEIRDRLLEIISQESVTYTKDGLDALTFTAEGDMRQAINNLQATFTGFGLVNRENVFKVCDVPNVDDLKKILDHMLKGEFQPAQSLMKSIFDNGYMAYDITNTFNKVIQNHNGDRDLQFEFLRQIAFLKARILEGIADVLIDVWIHCQMLQYIQKLSQQMIIQMLNSNYLISYQQKFGCQSCNNSKSLKTSKQVNNPSIQNSQSCSIIQSILSSFALHKC